MGALKAKALVMMDSADAAAAREKAAAWRGVQDGKRPRSKVAETWGSVPDNRSVMRLTVSLPLRKGLLALHQLYDAKTRRRLVRRGCEMERMPAQRTRLLLAQIALERMVEGKPQPEFLRQALQPRSPRPLAHFLQRAQHLQRIPVHARWIVKVQPRREAFLRAPLAGIVWCAFFHPHLGAWAAAEEKQGSTKKKLIRGRARPWWTR